MRSTEQLASHESRYSRYTDPEQVQSRRRRRWAAGYIDPVSCPSHAYIDTRSRRADPDQRPDTEYMTRSRSREDEYTQAREPRNTYSSRHNINQRNARRSRYYDRASSIDSKDEARPSDSLESSYDSDAVDLVGCQQASKQATADRRYDSDTGEGSDIVVVNRRDVESDTASIRSRRSSHSWCDGQSIRSLDTRPDTQDANKRDVDSSSDSEGGYISLNDYIASRSDCVSNPSMSDDGGEGSDMVASHVRGESGVGEGSRVAHGSDVASLSDSASYDDEEDCIEAGNYHDAQRRTYS